MEFVWKETSQSLLTIFSVCSLGYLLGSIKVRGISLSTAAIFLVGLIFGHFGMEIPSILQTVGLTLFITSVGLSSGATFFQRLRQSGIFYVALCLVIAGIGALLCISIIRFFDVDAPLAVGLLTGAFTTSPGFAAAKDAVASNAQAAGRIAAGYGIAYPLGVVCKVLAIQLIPRVLHADMDKERRLISISPSPRKSTFSIQRRQIDGWGLFSFSCTVVLGTLLGAVSVPLPGGSLFSLGTTGGPLIMGLLISHFGHIGPVDFSPNPKLNGAVKELGLMLFLSGSGVEGGHALAEILSEHGAFLLLFGFLLVSIPLSAGIFLSLKLFKLPLLNALGSITASMTCTPSLAALIQLAETDDVSAAYATTYPIALVTLIILVQVLLAF